VYPGAEDRQVARRLAREARAAQRAQLAQARAVSRRERKVAKARQRLPVQAVVAVGAGLAAIPFDPNVLFLGASALAAWGAARSVGVLRSPAPPTPPALPGPVPLPPPPHPGSAAFPAVRRLEAVRLELSRLLPLVSPAGRAAAEEAWEAASEADLALRWQAARLAAVEPHGSLDPALLQTLEEGVQCQERLVTAVADLVAASADPLAGGRLQDATDALHGLAQGLREVR
jgi:hypothetical protein